MFLTSMFPRTKSKVFVGGVSNRFWILNKGQRSGHVPSFKESWEFVISHGFESHVMGRIKVEKKSIQQE